MLKIPQGKCSREVQSIFIIIFHKHGNDNTLMQENPREKTLTSYHGELMSFCHCRHAGQANTCKGVSLRNRNELERIHRNASPRGL